MIESGDLPRRGHGEEDAAHAAIMKDLEHVSHGGSLK
jgi:hypothetical protein